MKTIVEGAEENRENYMKIEARTAPFQSENDRGVEISRKKRFREVETTLFVPEMIELLREGFQTKCPAKIS